MKSTISFFALIALIAQPYTFGQSSAPVVTEVQTLTIAQATTSFSLEHTEKEPIYVTQQQPDTCYHDVQQGTRQDCQTLNNHQCTTHIVNECNNVAYPVCQTVEQNVCNPVSYPVCTPIERSVCEPISNEVCQTVPQNVCENFPSQECSDVTVPVCQSVPRSQCDTVQECTTVDEQVCHGQGAAQVCQTVPRRQCSPTTQCHTVQDQVCHNETQHSCHTVNHSVCHTENHQQCHTETTQSCHTVPDQVCHTETRQDCHVENQQQCHDEYRQECSNVPEQTCTDTPYQSCQTVPNMVNTPYACTRPVQVQTGERVKTHVLAAVQIVLQNFGLVDLSQDQLTATLTGNDVSLKLSRASNKVIFHVVKKDQQVQVISPTDTKIVTTFTLDAIALDQLAQLAEVKVTHTVLNFDKILFNLEGADLSRIPVSLDAGHLQILVRKPVFLGHRMVTIIDSDFPATAVKLSGTEYEIDFASFNINPLQSRSHDVAFSVGIKTVFNPAELLNPEILNRVSLAPLSASFSGFPVQ
jgi:hypothetical protein